MAKQQLAVAYIRVSGESQVSGDGPERQRRVISAWAKRARTTIVAEYADLAVSGTKSADDRPAMSKLIADLTASNGVPPTIVIERPDRLARDLAEGELIIQRLQKLGVCIMVAETGQSMTDNSSPTAVLVRQILGAVSQFDKASIVGKLRAARAVKRAATGRCEGRKPYGTRPGEQAGVELIMQRRVAGDTLKTIAEKLDEAGIRTRQGKPWTFSAIKRIADRKLPQKPKKARKSPSEAANS